MDIKRLLTTILGLPIVVLIFCFGNKYVIGVALFIVSIICMSEYFGAIRKVSKPMTIIGYLSNLYIIAAIFIDDVSLLQFMALSIPIVILLLFFRVIVTDMKVTFKDAAYTLLGILYIPFFFTFLELVRCMDNGKIMVGYIFVISWGTDIFAYLIGKRMGKHKFSKISPKKSVEGCIAGVIGAVITTSVYTLIINKFFCMQFSYVQMGVISVILSIISQIGDFVASSIKRFVNVKDYSNLLPGHGGMLDRMDSLLFISPFVYMIFSVL